MALEYVSHNFLYPFQKTMVRWMKNRENTPVHLQSNGERMVMNTRLGFLCNPPGTGKTRICSALLKDDKYNPLMYEHLSKGAVIGDGLLTMCTFQTHPSMNSSLIIASESKMEIWKKELSLFLIPFHVITKKNHFRTIDWTIVSVFLVTPSMYNFFIEETYGRGAWNRIIYEYPLFNTIYNMKKPISRFIWIIMNNPKQLFYHRFTKHHFFSDFVHSLDHQCIQWISLRSFYHSIQYYISRVEPYHTYLYLYPSLSILLEHIRNNQTEIYFKKLCVFNKLIDPYPDILHTVYPNMKKENIDKNTCFSTCFICMNVSHEIWIQVPCCFQILCSDCLQKWLKLKYQCPNCRMNITTLDHLLFFKNNAEWMEAYRLQKSDIHEKILYLLSKNHGIPKVLLFSIMEIPDLQSIFDDIFILTKDIQDNKQKIENFRKKNSKTLLCVQNERMIHGFEIPECTDIIFIQWSTEQKSYLIGRVQRIGRNLFSPPLHVYHFL